MYPKWDTLDAYTINALPSYVVHDLLRVLETFKYRMTVKQVCNLNCQGALDGEDLHSPYQGLPHLLHPQ